jgi:hypothetical protein
VRVIRLDEDDRVVSVAGAEPVVDDEVELDDDSSGDGLPESTNDAGPESADTA